MALEILDKIGAKHLKNKILALFNTHTSDTNIHVPSTCTETLNWDNATATGWYMANNAVNAPTTGWFFGRVIAHTTEYLLQEVYAFTSITNEKNVPKYIRVKHNSIWCPWINVTVEKAVPVDAKFTDTQNTAGATDSSSKLYLIGATTQSTNPQTYSHDTVYVEYGHLYSNGKQVVNLSDTQALTNKTYNGYSLGAACAKGVSTTVATGDANLVTSGAVYTAIENSVGTVNTILNSI